MGKKTKKAKSASAESETGMPRHVRREVLEIVNYLFEKCSVPFGSQSTEWNDYLDVYKLVERLRKKQQHYVMPLPSRAENMSAFTQWLTSHGVDMSSVTIEQFTNEGYGLKAARDIEESEQFLSVPRQLMMTTETAKASVLGQLIKDDRILQSMPNVVMSLHVLCELSTPDSFWQPYLKTLPDVYTTPLYFTPDELQLLKGSPIVSEILYQYRNITRQYSYFFRLFQGHTEGAKIPIKNFCFDDYRWAVSTVMTRQNQIPSLLPSSNSESDSLASPTDTALIPLWDMCNHTNGYISTDYNTEKQCSECFAMQHFDHGSQILIFYGSRSNAELFLHNGFVYDANEHDRLNIKMGVSKNDRLYAMKTEVLARISLSTNRTFSLYCNPDRHLDTDLLAYLRVFSMDQDTLLQYLMGEGSSLRQQLLRDIERPVNVDNETKAWAFLETRAQLLLRAYSTTVEDDIELLSKGGLSTHASLAVRLRLAEKKILLSGVVHAASQKATARERTERAESMREESESASHVAAAAAADWKEFNVSSIATSTGEEEFVRVDGVHVYGSELDRAATEEEFRNSVLCGNYRTGSGCTSELLASECEFANGASVEATANTVALPMDPASTVIDGMSQLDVNVGTESVLSSEVGQVGVDGVGLVVCSITTEHPVGIATSAIENTSNPTPVVDLSAV